MFSTPVQTGPGAHPPSDTMGTGSFPGAKQPGRGVDHQPPPPSSAEVKQRVELYIFSPFGTSWPVLGCTLVFPFCTNNLLAVWKNNTHKLKENSTFWNGAAAYSSGIAGISSYACSEFTHTFSIFQFRSLSSLCLRFYPVSVICHPLICDR